jgi:RNA polymerase sigma-70 factor (ECF subfamily)
VVERSESLRPLLFSIAYRMVGSVGEAEDLVQESFLRLYRAVDDGEDVRSPKAWLSAVITRLSIDHLRSARVRRETYVGTWFPEPLQTDGTEDAATRTEMADTLSMAFLLLLETLTPVERAVFLLHDVFGYEFAEIAEIVDKREDNARQLAARARKRIEEGRPRFEVDRAKRDELATAFLAATLDGDVKRLEAMLAADVTVAGDGGGKGAALPQPIQGRVRAARFLAGFSRVARRDGIAGEIREVNGQPGIVAWDPQGRVIAVVSLEIADGVVQAVRAIANPDKLRHLRA